ncbi:MAG: 30S ribosomal protein S8 [Candidatus Magasanikiibacteriota bacterium]
MMTDPIADMLTRIRNAQLSRRANVVLPFSKVKKAIADILAQEKYVGKVEIVEEKPVKKLTIELLYNDREPQIRSLVRVSKPGYRIYRKSEEMPRILNDFGVAVISTSQGFMTNKQARKLGIGGEIICSVY